MEDVCEASFDGIPDVSAGNGAFAIPDDREVAMRQPAANSSVNRHNVPQNGRFLKNRPHSKNRQPTINSTATGSNVIQSSVTKTLIRQAWQKIKPQMNADKRRFKMHSRPSVFICVHLWFLYFFPSHPPQIEKPGNGSAERVRCGLAANGPWRFVV